MEGITLIKISKKTDIVRQEKLESLAELEKRLSSLSTSHYNLYTFFVKFYPPERLERFFVNNYNPNYFTFHYDKQAIEIHKLKVGEKRKKVFKKNPVSKEVKVSRAIKRLQKKYNLIYDKDLGILELIFENGRAILELNEKDVRIENVSINDISVEQIKEMNKQAFELVKYFDKLRERI